MELFWIIGSFLFPMFVLVGEIGFEKAFIVGLFSMYLYGVLLTLQEINKKL